MQQLMQVWVALSLRRRIIVIAATLAMFAAVLGLGRMATAPRMALLYAGLESGAAGDVINALEQRGIPHEVRGDSIYVAAQARDSLRMTMAGEGLPRNTGKGYELLDDLSGFGTTSQMFSAAYWRAKEGELARTILAHPDVHAARVHIASAEANPFRRDTSPTASVSVTTGTGGLTAGQGKALRYLVASAVNGLAPEDVSVIDADTGLVTPADETRAHAPVAQAERLRENVRRLLEARVGPGNAFVEVSVETVTRRESIRERRIDPESRIAISTETTESSQSATDRGGGDVTVASNLPDTEASGENSDSRSRESRERVNYEVSQTERQITRDPGAIKRLTVAVLVNGLAPADETSGFAPRPAEEIAALRELVASAVGYNEARGDVITLKSMQFMPAVPSGTVAEPALMARLGLDPMSLIQMAVLGLVSLILGLFVLRPILTRNEAAALPRISAPADDPGAAGTPGPDAEQIVPLSGEIQDDATDDRWQLARTVPSLAADGQDPVERLRKLIGERQEETVEILRSWLGAEEEKA